MITPLDLLHNRSSSETNLPSAVAKKMLDKLPSKIWSDPTRFIIDTATKQGSLLKESLYLFNSNLPRTININDKEEDNIILMDGFHYNLNIKATRIQYILQYMLYGVAVSAYSKMLTQLNIYNNADDIENIGNVYCIDEDATTEEKNKQREKIMLEIKNQRGSIDVVVSNPPYHELDGAGGEGKSGAKPIYHQFIDLMISIKPRLGTYIVPSKWMTGGKGMSIFRRNLIAGNKISSVTDYPDGKECFPSVTIKGGVCHFVWDAEHTGDCAFKTIKEGKVVEQSIRPLNRFKDIIIRNNIDLSIIDKVLNLHVASFSSIVSAQTPFGITTNFKNYEVNHFKNSVILYGNKINMKNLKGVANGKAYIKRDLIKKNINAIDKFKVYLVYASGGSDTDVSILGKPFLGVPNSICSQTYLSIGEYDTALEAENVMDFINTKFFRYMVSTRKKTQHGPKGVFTFVPLLDMSKSWDDKSLYALCSLTLEEQKLIEDKISFD